MHCLQRLTGRLGRVVPNVSRFGNGIPLVSRRGSIRAHEYEGLHGRTDNKYAKLSCREARSPTSKMRMMRKTVATPKGSKVN
ncbi:hypothetical protein BC936DRAFT_148371 [Jimgerdemannia flammicorona]|uniref:Uncharacterized protein n=1 Tax=Jimgerdemannia flammicorona TaxID=994334 RepID=A0A433D354_9FUNG|nr:hypothetical protein BC936DRAFT_148371 [Jimgerdemannia flammicorona]